MQIIHKIFLFILCWNKKGLYLCIRKSNRWNDRSDEDPVWGKKASKDDSASFGIWKKPRKRNMGKDSLNWKIQNSKGWTQQSKSFWWQYLPPSRSSASRQSAKKRTSGQPRQRLKESKNRPKPVSRFSGWVQSGIAKDISHEHGDSQGAAQGSRGDHRPPRQGQRLKAEAWGRGNERRRRRRDVGSPPRWF